MNIYFNWYFNEFQLVRIKIKSLITWDGCLSRNWSKVSSSSISCLVFVLILTHLTNRDSLFFQIPVYYVRGMYRFKVDWPGEQTEAKTINILLFCTNANTKIIYKLMSFFGSISNHSKWIILFPSLCIILFLELLTTLLCAKLILFLDTSFLYMIYIYITSISRRYSKLVNAFLHFTILIVFNETINKLLWKVNCT